MLKQVIKTTLTDFASVRVEIQELKLCGSQAVIDTGTADSQMAG